MTSSLSIRIIDHGSAEYDQTVALRDEILRRPLGLTFSPESLAAEVSDVHIACYRDGRLAGCLILSPVGDGSLKMRQVAVDAEAQGSGIGRALVEYSEEYARRRGFGEITMHARDTAVQFYLKLGYEQVGEPFVEVSIPHRKLCKSIEIT